MSLLYNFNVPMNKKQIPILIWILIIVCILFFLFQNKNGTSSSNNSNLTTDKNINDLNIPLKSKEEIKKELAQKEIAFAENIKEQNDFFNEAIENFDTDICNKITDTKKQQECLDNVYLWLSKEKNEISYCMKIKDSDKITNCKNLMYYDLAIKNNSLAFCNKIKSDNALIKNCNTNIIFATLETKDLQWDTKICDTLTWSDKEYCINRIKKADDLETLRDAVEWNDSGDCSSITDVTLKNNCLDVINIDKAINEKNISLCDKIVVIDKKTQCRTSLWKILWEDFLREAIEKNDLNICNKITDNMLKITCSDNIYMKKAYSEKNIWWCDKLQNESNKSQCKNDLSLILKQN